MRMDRPFKIAERMNDFCGIARSSLNLQMRTSSFNVAPNACGLESERVIESSLHNLWIHICSEKICSWTLPEGPSRSGRELL